MPSRGQVTERTFYPALIDELHKQGGQGASEVSFENSEPDVIFDLLGEQWLLGVKIDETSAILKSAFIQYQRHKDATRRSYGILVFLPPGARSVTPTHEGIARATAELPVTAIIDTPGYKVEYRGLTVPALLRRVRDEVGPQIAQRARQTYSLSLVIKLLQQQVNEMMETVSLTDPQLMQVITDRSLLSGISAQHLNARQLDDASRFLASYIVLSQILFLRILSTGRPDLFSPITRPVTHHRLRQAFRQVLQVNYRPIFEIDVLDAISEEYLRDTFDLIWGLEVEQSRYELPGRIFHELMPKAIRKLLAAFYTRPQAAELLAQLAIEKSNETIMDPACGSGTILTAGYRRKLDLFQNERQAGNPHKRFVEEEIFGADIMPFAVHLTSANLSAMDPATSIAHTQIMQSDSLKLAPDGHYSYGLQLAMFPAATSALTSQGESRDIDLKRVHTVLMNPPFTKVERGIRKYVDMERFTSVCGGEIGLWGHFIALGDTLLKDGGVFAGVIPISLLRGREADRIRSFILTEWTPLYIIKSTVNYGFSEWSEYRDILFIARKAKPPAGHHVKVALIKSDLADLTQETITHIATRLRSLSHLRADDLDIESFPLTDLRARASNLMWFCGVTAFAHRDTLTSFIDKTTQQLTPMAQNAFREGYRPVPEGVSSFMFMTRNTDPARVGAAFLQFGREDAQHVYAHSEAEVDYTIEKSTLTPSLRTGIGLNTMDVTHGLDYVARTPYQALDRVLRATGFQPPNGAFQWSAYWQNVERELASVTTRFVAVHRINPYSPNTRLTAFFADMPFAPSNTLNVVLEPDPARAKALCTLMNSVVFLAQFFLLKEETTGRYINVRFYDYAAMKLTPSAEQIPALTRVFDTFGQSSFTALRDQLDQDFDARYQEYRLRRQGNSQLSMFPVTGSEVRPTETRVNFDLAVCQALGAPLTRADLLEVYSAIVSEMMVTLNLKRD